MTRGVQVPPPIDLSALLENSKIFSHLRHLPAEEGGRYLHWDELRHRPLPERWRTIGGDGLGSHQAWWGVLKLARQARSLALPLISPAGAAATVVISDSIARACTWADQQLAGRIAMPDVPQGSLRAHRLAALVDEAISSSQLEGASTTRAAGRALIASARPPRTDHERMVIGNYHAMKWVDEHHQRPLTIDALFELHSLVLNEPPGLTAAERQTQRFRRADDVVTITDLQSGQIVFTPPPAATLGERMDAFLAFANEDSMLDDDQPYVHPIVRAILVHFWLAYEHPFTDGNGRTARALFHWSMRRQGYWLADYVSISQAIGEARAQYDRAFIHTETDELDTTYFVVNQLQMLRRGFKALTGVVAARAQDLAQLQLDLRGTQLNLRQRLVISRALREPGLMLTIAEHQLEHGVTYQTARTDLLGLAAKGYLGEDRRDRKTKVFYPAPDLEERLRNRPMRRRRRAT